jgi:hypothetical protein
MRFGLAMILCLCRCTGQDTGESIFENCFLHSQRLLTGNRTFETRSACITATAKLEYGPFETNAVPLEEQAQSQALTTLMTSCRRKSKHFYSKRSDKVICDSYYRCLGGLSTFIADLTHCQDNGLRRTFRRIQFSLRGGANGSCRNCSIQSLTPLSVGASALHLR